MTNSAGELRPKVRSAEGKSDQDLEDFARRVRRHVVRLAGGGGCFLGASLSCADILTVLYRRVLRFDPARPDDPNRDFLILSKGHDVPALYGTFVELGMLDENRLENHLSPHDDIYWHPNRAIPGVEFHSGSLGHCLSVGMGIAHHLRLSDAHNRVVVLLGDGELNEGSVWEALLVASALRLDNLLVVVDRNGFQANLPTETLIPLEPLAEKFAAFGCDVRDVDGHDVRALERAMATAPDATGPTAVIARTKRGKGIKAIDGRADRWFCRLRPSEIDDMLAELDGHGARELQSETLVVR